MKIFDYWYLAGLLDESNITAEKDTPMLKIRMIQSLELTVNKSVALKSRRGNLLNQLKGKLGSSRKIYSLRIPN